MRGGVQVHPLQLQEARGHAGSLRGTLVRPNHSDRLKLSRRRSGGRWTPVPCWACSGQLGPAQLPTQDGRLLLAIMHLMEYGK